MSQDVTPVGRHFGCLINIFFTHGCPFAMLNDLEDKNPDKDGNSKEGNCKIYKAAA